MRPSLLAFALLLTSAALVTTGCNPNVHVTGRVTYPDGRPVTTGQVIFTDDFRMGKSDLDANGEYSIHSVRRNDGIPKGFYRVYITGAFGFATADPIRDKLQAYRMDELVPLVDMQYTNPDMSGWSFELKKNAKIDLTVYPPNEVPEDQRTEAAKYAFDPEYRKQVDREKMSKPEPENLSGSSNRRKRLVNPNQL